MNRNTRLIFLTLMILIAITSPIASAQSSEESQWLEYTDPLYGFSVEYPSGWEVDPRKDFPNLMGGSVIFSESSECSMKCGASACRKIEIGLYLTEHDPDQPLDEWSEKYDKAGNGFSSDEVYVKYAYVKQNEPISREIFQKSGISPLTEFTYVNIPYGKTVWFIWINSASEESAVILNHMTSSMKFGDRTPKTLQEAYGQDFQPIPLRQESSSAAASFSDTFPTSNNPTTNPNNYCQKSILAPSGYSVPVMGPTTRYIPCGDTNAEICNGTHKNSLAKAIDIIMPVGVNILNSADSQIYGIYYGTSGYGWYVMMRDTISGQGHIAYYAHLSAINQSSMELIQDLTGYVPRGYQVGQSGKTGNATGPHLHFHVRTTGGAAVNLGGMSNLILNSNYPNCGHTTCPGFFECTCGQVY